MKRQIRLGIFETNSSSTHALSVSGDALNDVPKDLRFGFGEFGWECEVYQDVQTKADYLWTYIFNMWTVREYPKKEDGTEDYSQEPTYRPTNEYVAWKAFLRQACKEAGVENVTFRETPTGNSWFGTGYIDHSYELKDFVKKLGEDKNLLKQFLFCYDSGIETGNDNDDMDVSFQSKNSILEFYKGN